ncbi:MAG: DUF5030 domain-containing protein [Paraprevotella sp.]|nr:DUF5030 domain-containing protein [Paraprevotella sp.]
MKRTFCIFMKEHEKVWHIISCILLLASCTMNAQPVWKTYWYGPKGQMPKEETLPTPSLERVTVKEMTEGFHAAFTKKKQELPRNCDLKGMANLLVGKNVLSSCPLLTNAMELQGWWVVEEVEEENGGGQRYLTLHELNSYSGDTAAATKIRHALAQKYGKGDITPATWYTGLIGELEHPVFYMDFTVSPHLSFTSVKQGAVSGRDVAMRFSNQTYYDEAQGLKRIVADGHWIDRMDYEQVFFSHDVNRAWATDGRKTYAKDSFSLLLATEEDGSITIYPLLPKELTDNQKGLLAALQETVDKFPEWCFRYLYTSDGRIFPGRYVRATYSSDGEWTFIDYFRFDPKAKDGIRDFSPLSFYKKKKLGTHPHTR